MTRARKRFRGRQRRWLLSLIVVLVVSAVGWSWGQQGQRAPAFTLPSGTGDPVALESYLGHQPVVLVFYMGDG